MSTLPPVVTTPVLISGLDPPRGPVGGGNSVTIGGSNLTAVTAVTFNSADATVQQRSGTSLMVAVPPALSAGGGKADITVWWQGPSGLEKGAVGQYEYVVAPVITGYRFGKKGVIELSGQHFSCYSSVTVGGTPATRVDRATDTRIDVTRGDRVAGALSVAVVSPGGSSNTVQLTAPAGPSRAWVFAIEMVYLLVLLFVGLLYVDEVNGGFWRQHFPDPLASIPLGVYWFGALGAVALSLSGVVYHEKDWDPGYLLWYVSRPLFGAIFAVVLYLIFAGGILTTGGTAGSAAGGTAATTAQVKPLFYYAIAFLIGYREASFRSLISRVGDVVFGADQTTDTTSPVTPATAPDASTTPTAPVSGTPAAS